MAPPPPATAGELPTDASAPFAGALIACASIARAAAASASAGPSARANVRNAPNFGARTRVITPASPMQSAIIGLGRSRSEPKASMQSRTLRARHATLATAHASAAPIAATWRDSAAGRPEKSFALRIRRVPTCREWSWPIGQGTSMARA